jgi:hypothetical protein
LRFDKSRVDALDPSSSCYIQNLDAVISP